MPSPRNKQRRSGGRVVIGRGRETSLPRRVGYREQQSTVLIATNGHSTERKYLTALKSEPWVQRGKVIVVFENGSPLEVVRGAYRRRNAEDYDAAWAVCDVDTYSTDGPTREASRNEVHLLWSNPCFEVWLILHKANCTAYLENADKCIAKLESIIGEWDKTKLDFSIFRDGIDDAVRRAKELGDPPAANPSTAVWRLIEALKIPHDSKADSQDT
jgi:RloB-like protein